MNPQQYVGLFNHKFTQAMENVNQGTLFTVYKRLIKIQIII